MKVKGFNPSQGAQQMLMNLKVMFDRYYCIKHFVTRKIWRKCFEKFVFHVPVMARKGTLPAIVLTRPLLGQLITSV